MARQLTCFEVFVNAPAKHATRYRAKDSGDPSHSGLSDLRIADARGRQVPYLLERRDESLSLSLSSLARQAKKGDPSSLSRYRVELPYPSLPSARLVLATPARVFDREVRLVEVPEPALEPQGDREPGERTVAQAFWRHASERNTGGS